MANTVSLQHTPCNPRGPLYIYPFEQEHILFRGFDGTWFRGNNAVWVDSRNAAKERFHVFRRAILQLETEDIAVRANQKSTSKFSVKSQSKYYDFVLARNFATGNGRHSVSLKSEICIKIFRQITTRFGVTVLSGWTRAMLQRNRFVI